MRSRGALSLCSKALPYPFARPRACLANAPVFLSSARPKGMACKRVQAPCSLTERACKQYSVDKVKNSRGALVRETVECCSTDKCMFSPFILSPSFLPPLWPSVCRDRDLSCVSLLQNHLPCECARVDMHAHSRPVHLPRQREEFAQTRSRISRHSWCCLCPSTPCSSRAPQRRACCSKACVLMRHFDDSAMVFPHVAE